jgi:hypothetical protein
MNDQTTEQLRLVALLPDNQSSKRVTFSNRVQDIEIQSKLSDLSQTQPNKWQMPNIINLDSSGLRCLSWKEGLSWQDKIFLIPQLVSSKSNEVQNMHAWFSSLLSALLVQS